MRFFTNVSKGIKIRKKHQINRIHHFTQKVGWLLYFCGKRSLKIWKRLKYKEPSSFIKKYPFQTLFINSLYAGNIQFTFIRLRTNLFNYIILKAAKYCHWTI